MLQKPNEISSLSPEPVYNPHAVAHSSISTLKPIGNTDGVDEVYKGNWTIKQLSNCLFFISESDVIIRKRPDLKERWLMGNDDLIIPLYGPP